MYIPHWNIDDADEIEKRGAESLAEHFTDMADAISEFMGTPVNIVVWLLLVLGWTFAYAFVPGLASINILPAWSTSQAFNFPLNLVTTVLELFIGFFLAASSNRQQKKMDTMIGKMEKLLEHISDIDEAQEELIEEHSGKLDKIILMIET